MQNKNREWQAFKQGGFNIVYKSNDGLIFKTTHYDGWNTDTPERSVRLWNLINPELTPKAYVGEIFVDGVTYRGWIGPYIAGLDLKKSLQDPVITQQHDSLIAAELLAIYARTGRIIVDAAVPGNFIVTDSNQAICVDIGLAFRIDAQEEAYCSDITSRKSFVSNHAWQKLQQELIPNILYNKQSFYVSG